MPAFTLLPNGQGSFNAGYNVFGGALAKWQALSDGSDGTYIYLNPGGVGTFESETMQDLPSGAGSVVGSVTYNARASQDPGGSGSGTCLFILGASQSAQMGVDGFTTITGFSQAFADAPGAAAGSGWQVSQLNATELGCFNSKTVTMYFVDFWATGTYNPAPGGGAFLCSVVWPLLGACLGMQHMRGIARETARLSRGSCILRPHEYAEYLQALRDRRWPVQFDLGRVR